MTPKRFERLAEAYGGDWRRWPEGEREAARRLVETSPRARAAWAEACRLDGLLDGFGVAEAGPDLAERLADRVLATPAPRRAAPEPVRWWAAWLQPACGLAVAASMALCLSWLEPLGHAGAGVDPLLADASADGLGDEP